MAINYEDKKKIREQFGRHPKDSGSSEVQIALLSRRINELTEHFKKHKKDYGSKKGLQEIVSRRRKLLDYLKIKNPEKYKEIIEKLGLRG